MQCCQHSKTGCPFRYSGYDAYRRQKVGHHGKICAGTERDSETAGQKQIGYASVRGGISDRAEEIRRFQEDADCRVFVGQIAAAGLGITLTAASTMVFYSLDYSMSNFEQAKARIHRVSQTENCLYIYLTAKHTVDTKILRALRDKADLAKMLVDDYRNGSNPFQEGV